VAAIALAKHNHVRRAVYGMTLMLITTVLAVWVLA
jgi:heme/copper-type cytochrome/quinol oxidase subunit 4